MIPKENILDAWIMCEHLSEGTINLKDKKIKSFNELKGDNYYDFFLKIINEECKHMSSIPKKAGIIIYLNIFELSEVVNIIYDKYHIKPADEDIEIGNKFVLAVCFDQQLDLNENMTFLTGSGYIKNNRCVPDKKTFTEYEDSLKLEIEQIFDHDEMPDNEYKTFFNGAMTKLINKTGALPGNCCIEFIINTENVTNYLYSFFIDDLENAKKLNTSNLTDYLYGYSGHRINLDSKKDSPNFNAKIFDDILSPMNYPLGRFPSKTKYPLSFMQQVAVNLATGYDNRTIRSVNGPPGSGKTTLLQDVFAELILKQSYILANLSEFTIRGGEENIYYNNSSIGELPDKIAENNIVVASTNNEAVKNIVNNLPLVSKIDEKLLDQLKEADYFYKLSNCKFSTKWEKDNSGKLTEQYIKESSGQDKKWGLFSLEGGRAENMNALRAAIYYILEYLNDEYISDPSIYKKFLQEYHDVEELRKKGRDYAEMFKTVNAYRNDYEKKSIIFTDDRSKKENEVKKKISELEEKITSYTEKQDPIKLHLDEIISRRKDIQSYEEELETIIGSIKKQKPKLFSGRKIKNKYREMLNDAKQKLLNSKKEDIELAEKEYELKKELDINNRDILRSNDKITDEKNKLNTWINQKERELSKLKSMIDELQQEISAYSAAPLDMTLDYENLQMSSPWFNEEYRIAQSKLFITALRARKQFLFDNKDNIYAAITIWKDQKRYQDKKRLIGEAWNWINFAIPVISSTFASFRTMCKNLGENTLGHLFVDEAGQALPYAAVGAVYRSRHIMMVGDPSQIQPVQTLDPIIMNLLSKLFNANEKYISHQVSAQTLADSASQYGYYFDKNKWVGIPLWVHRRCEYPMFTIANKISYFNLMVQGNGNYGKTGWFDIRGKANNKYVKEQGDFLARKLEKMIETDPEIIDKNKPDKVYVITPFKNVAHILTKRLEKIDFTRDDDKGKATNIGTIHTFQGKEAPIVFLVMGADEKSKGAANWAVDEPNIMNVAVTRAKNEFYIIGNMGLYKRLNSKVVNETINIINDYRNNHPDLVDNDTTLDEYAPHKHSNTSV